MSHRRPEPRQAFLEQALRHALRLAVDPVEPAADGLDRIRAKIAERPRVARNRWSTTLLAGPHAVLGTAWRFLEPAVIWLRYWIGAVAERFRPDLGRAGWLGWLRPAAAVATGLLVVTGASWAITALPQAIFSAGNSGRYIDPGQGSSGPGSGHHSSQPGGGGSSSPARSASPHTSPSCRTGSGAPIQSASGSPVPSSSPSPSTSSSPSPGPSVSTSSSPAPTGSPTSSSTPTGTPSANITPSAQQIQRAVAAGLQVGASEAEHAGGTAQAGRMMPTTRLSTPKSITKSPGGANRGRSPCTS